VRFFYNLPCAASILTSATSWLTSTLKINAVASPYVSTLNPLDGAVTSNMAIVPAGADGKIEANADGLMQLILDISSYFAP
jgi:hypothetical protein